MKGREEIQIGENTKGKIVHIEHSPHGSYWIVFISHIEKRHKYSVIFRHTSIYNVGKGEFGHCDFVCENPEIWGTCEGCKIYEATEEEKQRIKDLIKNRGFKYVKAFNKLIKR